MNKIYLLTAAFAVMASLSGCSDTELASIDTAQEKTPIGFHTVGSQMGSRATIINSGNLKDTDFKVYAFDDTGNAFMGNNDTDEDYMNRNGVHIKYDKDASAWTYAKPLDLRYWPDSKLDFYAVSPATFPEDIHLFWKINKKEQTISYTSFDEYKTAGGNQNLDIMYAVAKEQKNSNGGKVSLAFKHILSQVLFKAKTNDVKMEVEINGMKFHNFQLGGIFTIPEGEPTRTDRTQPGSAFAVSTVGMNEITTVTSTGTDVFTKPMLFVPQILTAWVPSEKNIEAADNAKLTYLEISCRIKQNGSYLFGKTDYETLYVPFSATWQPGKRYVYTLIFGGGYTNESKPILTQVNFTASAEDWKPDDGNTTNGNDKVTQLP